MEIAYTGICQYWHGGGYSFWDGNVMIKMHLKRHKLPSSDIWYTMPTFWSMSTIRTFPLHLDIYNAHKTKRQYSTMTMSDYSTFNAFRGFSCQLILYLWQIVIMYSLTAVRTACFVKLVEANSVPGTEATVVENYFSWSILLLLVPFLCICLEKKFTENRNVKEVTSDNRAKQEQRGKYALGALVTVTALTREESFIKAAHDCYIHALL